MTFQIKIFDAISPLGLNQFDPAHYLVSRDTNCPDAILVRSSDLHQMPIPNSLQVVGRAGAGVNNIPVDALTALGIPVLNTPGANANAVKELVIAGLLMASRNICAAWNFTRQLNADDKALHQTIEKEKKRFAGFELPGKTLGVIGLGKIGVQVANAAIALGMTVIGYDPLITVRSAWDLSAKVQHAEDIKALFKQADFLTLHIPFNEDTKDFINAAAIANMKPGVILVNFARPGIVDTKAVAAAVHQGHVGYYICDFPDSLFMNHPNIITLPHLGASTKEAEENCATMIALQVKDYLQYGHIANAINFPNVKLDSMSQYRLAITNINVPNMVAQISSVLSREQINIVDMINKSKGNIAYTLIDINAPIKEKELLAIQHIEGVIRARALSLTPTRTVIRDLNPTLV